MNETSNDSTKQTRIDERFYRRIIDKTADAIIAIDSKQSIVFVNAALEKMFGYRAEELIGQHLNLLIPSRFHEEHDLDVSNFVWSGRDNRYMGDRQSSVTGCRSDGSEIQLGASILRVQLGDECLFAAVMRDISWRVDLIDNLTEMARLDPLTGYMNRRSFLEIATNECARAKRFGTTLSCLFFDLDHFKRVNDDFGHDAGDAVLRMFAKVARDELRTIDSFCRWGGEEFVALLPNADPKGAVMAAERVRRATEEMAFKLPDGQEIHLTVSIGGAYAAGPEFDIDAIVKQADDALYQAKREGRNRVTF